MNTVLKMGVAQRPRLGFLGVGASACCALAGLVDGEVATPTMLWDISADALTRGLALAPDATLVATPVDLLEADIDGVVIAMPNPLHAGLAMAALSRGLAVFCQAPLGRNAIEVARVVGAARGANRLLAADLSYRFTNAMRAVRGVVRDGMIGEVFAVELTFHNAYRPEDCGCVVDVGTHLLDLALWALEFPKVREVASQLFARGRPLSTIPNAEIFEDRAEAQIALDTGAVIRMACSWRTIPGDEPIISAVFHGTRGSASFHNMKGSFIDFVGERYESARWELLHGAPDAWGGRALMSWASRLAAGDRYDRAVERLIDVAETLDAIRGVQPQLKAIA